MEYFKKYFSEIENWNAEEVKVLCPYHQDTNPSASINTEKGLFHCWVCDIGFNEAQFMAKVNNISTTEAIKLIDNYSASDDWQVAVAKMWSDIPFKNKVNELGLSDDTIHKFKLGLVIDPVSNRKTLGIPIFYNNILVDVRRYNLLGYANVPKVVSEKDRVGWVVPYDLLIDSNEPCYLFEGEKDMLYARELGINAFTLTGGANSVPNEYSIGSFENKDIIVCYDNDKAGQDGMLKIFKALKDVAKRIRYIDISKSVNKVGEDFYDFITKYKNDIFDFYALEIQEFDVSKLEKDILTTIKKALNKNILKKDIKSVVTITAEYADPYSVPTIVHLEKVAEEGKKDTLFQGEERKWYLEKKNNYQLLELIEANAKDEEVRAKLKMFMGIPAKEGGIEIKQRELRTIYKCTIADKDIDGSGVSLDLYSFDKLNVGGQYIIEYSIYPHPTKHQKLVAVCSKSKLIHDENNYILDKGLLDNFKIKGTIEERLDVLYQSAKHYVAKHLDFNIWLMTDLVFNSILDFNYGEEMKGALDLFLLGDTQVGKSECTSKLTELYNFGHFLSLKTSTTTGLIGGSSKVDGTYYNTIGAIPRQHKKLVVLEEFSGAKPDFIKTMTDIRSSNEIRITRVAGELKVPCKLRMITISNPVNDDNGNPRFLSTFPNGIMPIMELIKSAEDVSRYDGFLLIPKIEKTFNPFNYKLQGTPIPKEAYEHKINWVYTRLPENVKFDEGVESYIWEKGQELNTMFECNFPLFGVTTSKKLAKFSVALASLLFNVDESYENIVVTKEIVDYMVEKQKELYSLPIFRLNDYAREYKEYSNYNEEDVKELEALYAKNATLFDFLHSNSKTSRFNLSSVSGLKNDDFNPIFNKLVSDKYIKLNMDSVYPTDKFRKVYKIINKKYKINQGTLIDTQGVTFINDLEGKEQ